LGGNAGPNLTWNGTNGNGQYVQNGLYYLQITSTNGFGQVTSVTDPVNVLGSTAGGALMVYNSAGEVVAALDISGLPAQPVGMSLDLPAGKNGVTGSTNPKAVSPTGGVTVLLTLANGQTVPEYWDGLSSAGQPLQSGIYTLDLTQPVAGSNTVVKSLPVTILGSVDQSAQAMAGSATVVPNPVQSSGGVFTVQYQGNGQDSAFGELYNLMGERVGQAGQGPIAGTGVLVFSGKWSGGIYLLDFEVRDGSAPLARRVLKVAIIK